MELENESAKAAEMQAEFNRIATWSEIFDSSDISTKKMICGYIIKQVTVYRDYQLSIKFNITVEQFLNGIDSAVQKDNSTAIETRSAICFWQAPPMIMSLEAHFILSNTWCRIVSITPSKMMTERTNANKEYRTLPLNTTGQSLLSGNIFIEYLVQNSLDHTVQDVHRISCLTITFLPMAGLVVADIASEPFEELQIIKPELFKLAQSLMTERTNANKEYRTLPLNTTGQFQDAALFQAVAVGSLSAPEASFFNHLPQRSLGTDRGFLTFAISLPEPDVVGQAKLGTMPPSERSCITHSTWVSFAAAKPTRNLLRSCKLLSRNCISCLTITFLPMAGLVVADIADALFLHRCSIGLPDDHRGCLPKADGASARRSTASQDRKYQS